MSTSTRSHYDADAAESLPLLKVIVTGKSSGLPLTLNSMLPLALDASMTGCCQSSAPRRVGVYSPSHSDTLGAPHRSGWDADDDVVELELGVLEVNSMLNVAAPNPFSLGQQLMDRGIAARPGVWNAT